ncbi:MAG: energy transducer TonB [Pseudohongiellaceae bacterium]
MIAVRWLVSLALAAGITLALFWFMQALIATGSQLDERANVTRIVDATMPDINMEVQREIDEPEPMEDIQETPPEDQDREFDMDGNMDLGIGRDNVNVGGGVEVGMAGIGATDGEMLPLVNITPSYPTRAAQRGIEGWCQVRFTVTAEGGVRDVEVIDAEPSGIFDRSSIRAAERFRFQPRVVDGEPVDVPGVQYVFRYELEE